MKTLKTGLTMSVFLRFFFLSLVAVTWCLGTADVWAADQESEVNPGVRTEWVRLLINSSRGDVEADAAGAVDGIKSGAFGFHTQRQKDPWWQVDLQKACALDRVLVFNRSGAQERARYLTLQVSPDGLAWQDVYKHDGIIFGGSFDKKPLTIPLKDCTARFVRIQITDSTWMHLSEVEVYGGAGGQENLALGKPARQSSISQWSTRAKANPGTIVFRADDVPMAAKIINTMLIKMGPDPALRDELNALAHAGQAPDTPRWVSLYATVSSRVEKQERLQRNLDLLNIPALKRAITDLGQTYPDEYPHAAVYLSKLDQFAQELPDIQKALQKDSPQAHERLEEIMALKRRALLANPLINFDEILLVKRSANRLGLPANWQGNCSTASTGYDNEIATLSLASPEKALTTFYRPSKSEFVGDLDLNFDADKMLFSMPGTHGRWQIWQIGINGQDLVQVTRGQEPDVDNYDACYLPDGRVIFDSTAPMTGVPCVRGSSHVANLYLMNGDGSGVRQLCFDQDHDWCPTLLNNGRVLYQRWEYTDTPHSNTRMLFHMNPDGTSQMEYYGSNSYWPNSIFYAKAIPDHPTKVVGIVTGHHGVARMGEMVVFDPGVNRHEASGVVQRIPGFGQTVEPTIKDQLVNDSWPKFLHPYPLNEKYFLVSAKPTASSLWGIYLVDIYDNMLLLKEETGYVLFEPVAKKTTTRPPIMPDRIDPASKNATVYLADVHAGPGLKGVPRGAVKKLRVFTYNYGYRGMGGLLGTVGMDGPWDIKRVLGTVPVEADGSANFVIPANTPVSIQPLDEEGKALQVMRSWMTAMPGEVLSCVGCHEKQNLAPPSQHTIAARRKPSNITPWYGPTRGFSFQREVQPVLDQHCISCHTPDSSVAKEFAAGKAMPDLRGTVFINDWKSVTPGNAGPDGGKSFSVSYNWLHRYVRRPGIESDYHLLTPMDYHADTTELVQMLKKGHHGVKLDTEAWDRLVTWIDLNAPYHGYWHEIVGDRAKTLSARQAELREKYAGINDNMEIIPAIVSPPAQPVTRVARVEDYPKVTSPKWPFDKAMARQYQTQAGANTWAIDLGDGVKLELARVPAGEFVMGNTDAQSGRDEEPCAVVKIAKDFWIGKLEVSNEVFHCYDPGHDSRVESKHAYQFGVHGFPLNGPKQPVVRISWQEALAFCDWLSRKTGYKFSLPTEAQWEYACRAGSDKAFSFGDVTADFSTYGNMADQKLREFADDPYQVYAPLVNATVYDDWIPRDTRFNDGTLVSSPVGKYRPNAWGIHDMHGNVSEWTRTSYRPYPYSDDDGRNALSTSGDRGVRGGSWYGRPKR
ncbi:MAG: SUMF1/EgtB/PvdO family nonheme iron enzyme, partial [Phycisphaeraceae bacterium]|nr:SUMF1/EgtB/PvdO family nonheme iron enzyme [Phycisphaeraceae bacterium]